MSVEPTLSPIRLLPSTLLALHAAFTHRYPALLESAAAGLPLGRYDILLAFPGASLMLDPLGRILGNAKVAQSNFLQALDAWWQQERTAEPDCSSVPFRGGWLLFLGYELAGHIEPRLRLPAPQHAPIAQAIRIPAAIVYEHATAKAWIVVEPGYEHLIAQIGSDIHAVRTVSPGPASLLAGSISEEPPQHFLKGVADALEHIAAGNIYQANLSRTWRATLAPEVRAHHIYARLRETNPAPFSALVSLDGLSIVSSSPERLVQVKEGWVSTRPIAGTRPRGQDQSTDHDLARELHAHPKERAEHIMLIDLERNDLGRICEAGSVEVSEFMILESYAHVHHIVSNVRGRLRADATPSQVLAAVFPGGTITGCPKIRCMELIAELEAEARSAYTGSLGYLNRDGSMDLNILIRSLELHGNSLTLRAGAGIVADSVPERELEETRAKALGVLRALSDEQLQ